MLNSESRQSGRKADGWVPNGRPPRLQPCKVSLVFAEGKMLCALRLGRWSQMARMPLGFQGGGALHRSPGIAKSRLENEK